jgi:hypothetical protein
LRHTDDSVELKVKTFLFDKSYFVYAIGNGFCCNSSHPYDLFFEPVISRGNLNPSYWLF